MGREGGGGLEVGMRGRGRQTERDRETDRQTDRQTERDRDSPSSPRLAPRGPSATPRCLWPTPAADTVLLGGNKDSEGTVPGLL